MFEVWGKFCYFLAYIRLDELFLDELSDLILSNILKSTGGIDWPTALDTRLEGLEQLKGLLENIFAYFWEFYDF